MSVANIIGTGSQAGVAITHAVRLRLDLGGTSLLPNGDGSQRLVRRRFSSTMVDYYPFGGEGFHLSAGGRLDNRRRDHFSGNPLLYAPKGFSNGKSTGLRKLASAMTMGYNNSPEPGLSFGVEGGALLERGDPASRELYRFARNASTNDMRFRGGQRLNPVVQASFNYKF